MKIGSIRTNLGNTSKNIYSSSSTNQQDVSINLLTFLPFSFIITEFQVQHFKTQLPKQEQVRCKDNFHVKYVQKYRTISRSTTFLLAWILTCLRNLLSPHLFTLKIDNLIWYLTGKYKLFSTLKLKDPHTICIFHGFYRLALSRYSNEHENLYNLIKFPIPPLVKVDQKESFPQTGTVFQ